MDKIAEGLSKIDQSGGKTAGLTHVTKDMKASANTAPVVQPKAPASKKVEEAPKKQSFGLQGQKWVAEGQTTTQTIFADKITTKQTVYIFNCIGATIKVDGKCNTITIDGCKNTTVICNDVLALVEVVNSRGIKIHVNGKAPSVAIDKTDGIVVHLSRATMGETKIVASKSSEMNVQFPGATDDDAWIEKVLPEQFCYTVKAGKVTTEVSELYSSS